MTETTPAQSFLRRSLFAFRGVSVTPADLVAVMLFILAAVMVWATS